MVITISRENGSGGKYIAEQLSEKLGLPLYDSALIHMAAAEGNLNVEDLAQMDEISTESYLNSGSLLKGLFNKVTLDDVLFENEKKIIKRLAEGEDCIVVGRCSNNILKEHNTLDVFVYASDLDFKIERKKEFKNLSEEEAKKVIKEKDKRRAIYYQYHTGCTWGNKQDYDLCVNTFKTGVDDAVELIALMYRLRKGEK